MYAVVHATPAELQVSLRTYQLVIENIQTLNASLTADILITLTAFARKSVLNSDALISYSFPNFYINFANEFAQKYYCRII